jgi:hypothetical protein
MHASLVATYDLGFRGFAGIIVQFGIPTMK